jgi:hypothetical protein
MPLVDAVAWFEQELVKAKLEVKLRGSVEKASAMLPGVTEERFSQLQEVEAILRYLEIRMTKVKGTAFKKYLEGYNRTLTSRDAEKYADADDSVIEVAMLINQVALLRNSYQSIMKGLDVKHWQINNLVKLKTAGLEDYEVHINTNQ